MTLTPFIGGMKQLIQLAGIFGLAFVFTACADQPKSIRLACGNYVWEIVCGRDNTPKNEDWRQCNHNTLSVTDAAGNKTVIPDPPISRPEDITDERQPWMFEETTTAGLSCRPQGGKFYVYVDYNRGSGVQGAFIDLFEANGKRITITGVTVPGNKKPAEEKKFDWKRYRNLPAGTYPKYIDIEEQPGALNDSDPIYSDRQSDQDQSAQPELSHRHRRQRPL